MKSVSFLLIAAIGLFAQEPAHPRRAARSGPSNQLVKEGESQFIQSCGFCHGRAALGGSGGPNLMRSAVVRHDNNGDLVGAVIREGRPGKGMPPIPLNASQISAVVAFLHARLVAGDRRSAGRPHHDYSAKLLLTGDAQKGEAFFNGKGGCSSCHSPTGDLAGIAKKYEPIDLQTRFLRPQGPPPKVVVTLPSGDRVTGTLALLTNFDVALRDSSGWYRSWPVDSVKIVVKDPLARHRELLSKYTDADMHNMLAYLETLQ